MEPACTTGHACENNRFWSASVKYVRIEQDEVLPVYQFDDNMYGYRNVKGNRPKVNITSEIGISAFLLQRQVKRFGGRRNCSSLLQGGPGYKKSFNSTLSFDLI
jgi:hypothetical protein